MVGQGINLDPPDKAKPKGRAMDAAETKALKLGAKGPKLGTRRCKNCGIADGHNAATCLQKPENRERLAKIAGRKRGRPPGAKNRHGPCAAATEVGNEKMTHKRMTDDEEEWEDVDTDMEESPQREEPCTAPRKRGRPAGSKNK